MAKPPSRRAAPSLQAPAAYFADRVRRLRYFSQVRLESVGDLGPGTAETWHVDPDLFVSHPEASRAEPRDATPDARLWQRATLDGSIRALYASLRPLHVVAVGPGRLRELEQRMRFASLTLERVEGGGARATLPEQLAAGHRRFCGEPTAYLFHAGRATLDCVLHLHGRLRNAFLIDLGPALDACLAERVLGQGWSWIHWQATARHLGFDPGPRPAEEDGLFLPRAQAPARRRPTGPAPAVERRRVPARREEPPRRARMEDGDLHRCLTQAFEAGS